MAAPKILVLPGTTRIGSNNIKLAALAAKELTLIDADVTRISLADYPLPIYEDDVESRTGLPANAVRLKQMFMAHQGVFIASPEYSASVTPILKNTIDWVSRVRERGDPAYAAFKDRVFAISAASPESGGGVRSLMALRQILELGCGALVIPEQISIPNADDAFDEMDNIIDTRAANLFRAQLARLVDLARLIGGNGSVYGRA
jgi:NAD(P)H-dependent FMN reductase